jgi:hypothetical protein
METAQSIINDALQAILVQASEQPIQAVDFQTARKYLNRMMATFDAEGISLGYTVINLPTDLVTIPDGAIEGVIFNLAVRLLPTYDMPLTNELKINARESKAAMRNLAVVILPTSFPCTLPIGSGNEGCNNFGSDHFYPCDEDELLTESGGSILLETNT